MVTQKDGQKKEKSKGGSSAKHTNDRTEPAQTWEAALKQIIVSDDQWSCRLYMVNASGGQYEDLLDMLSTSIFLGRRRSFLLIDYQDIVEMLLGSPRPDLGQKRSGHGGTPDPAVELYRQATGMLRETGTISACLMSAVILTELKHIRTQETAVVETELPGTSSSPKPKTSKKEETDSKTTSRAESKESSKIQKNIKPDLKPPDKQESKQTSLGKDSRKSSTRRKTIKVVEEEVSHEPRQDNDNFCGKRPTDLKKRGEKEDAPFSLEKIVIKDDEPVDGPTKYVVLTGFLLPGLPDELEKRGLPVELLFRVMTRPRVPSPPPSPVVTVVTSYPDARHKKKPQREKKKRKGADEEGPPSEEPIEKLTIRTFWQRIASSISSHGSQIKVPSNLLVSDLVIPLATIRCIVNEQHIGDMVFDALAAEIYEHMKTRAIFDCYASNLCVTKIPDICEVFPPPPSPAPLPGEEGRSADPQQSADAGQEGTPPPRPAVPEPLLYRERLQALPPEVVSVPVMVGALVDQVALWVDACQLETPEPCEQQEGASPEPAAPPGAPDATGSDPRGAQRRRRRHRVRSHHRSAADSRRRDGEAEEEEEEEEDVAEDSRPGPRLKETFPAVQAPIDRTPVLVTYRDTIGAQFYNYTDRTEVNRLVDTLSQNLPLLQLRAAPLPSTDSRLKLRAAGQEMLARLESVVTSAEHAEYLLYLLMFESLYPELTGDRVSPRLRRYRHPALPTPNVSNSPHLLAAECGHVATDCDAQCRHVTDRCTAKWCHVAASSDVSQCHVTAGCPAQLRLLSSEEGATDVTARFKDHCCLERLDQPSMAQTLQELESSCDLLAARHLGGDDGLYLVYGHPRTLAGYLEQTWRHNVLTTVGFRDFLEHTTRVPKVAKWYEQEKRRLAQAEQKKRHDEEVKKEIKRHAPLSAPPKMTEQDDLPDEAFVAVGSLKYKASANPIHPRKAEPGSRKSAEKLSTSKQKETSKQHKNHEKNHANKVKRTSSQTKSNQSSSTLPNADQTEDAKKDTWLQARPPDTPFGGFDLGGDLLHVAGCRRRQYFENGSFITVHSEEYVQGSKYLSVSVTHGETSVHIHHCQQLQGEDMTVHLLGGGVLHLIPRLVEPPDKKTWKALPPEPQPVLDQVTVKPSSMRGKSPSRVDRGKKEGKDVKKKSVGKHKPPIVETPNPEVPVTEEEKKPEPPAEPVLIQTVRVSFPTGLVVELEPDPFSKGPEPHVLVRQYYLDAECDRRRVRLFVSEGHTVRLEDGEKGTVDLLTPDGSLTRCNVVKEPVLKAVGRPGSPESPAVGGTAAYSRSPDRAAESDCRYRLQPVYRVKGNGEQQQLGPKAAHLPRYLSKVISDPITRELYVRRQDGLMAVVRTDGTTIIHHTDGTRLTVTVPHRDGSPRQETTVCTDTSRQDISWILGLRAVFGEKAAKDWTVQTEHPDYARVVMRQTEKTCEVHLPKGAVIETNSRGTFTLRQADGTSLRMGLDAATLSAPPTVAGQKPTVHMFSLRQPVAPDPVHSEDTEDDKPRTAKAPLSPVSEGPTALDAKRTGQPSEGIPRAGAAPVTSKESQRSDPTRSIPKNRTSDDAEEKISSPDPAGTPLSSADTPLISTITDTPQSRGVRPLDGDPCMPSDSQPGAAALELSDNASPPSDVPQRPSGAGVICETVDGSGTIFRVTRKGLLFKVKDTETCPAGGLTLALRAEMERDTVLPRTPRLLVLYRDGDGLELVTSEQVSRYLAEVRATRGGQVWQTNHDADPEVRIVRVFRPVPDREMPAQIWKTPYKEDNIVPVNLRNRDLRLMCKEDAPQPALSSLWTNCDQCGPTDRPRSYRPTPPPEVIQTRELLHMPPVEDTMYHTVVKAVHAIRIESDLADANTSAKASEAEEPPPKRIPYSYQPDQLIRWLEAAKANHQLATGILPKPCYISPTFNEKVRREAERIQALKEMFHGRRYPPYFLSSAGGDYPGELRLPSGRGGLGSRHPRRPVAVPVRSRPAVLDLGAVRAGHAAAGRVTLENAGPRPAAFRFRPPAPLLGLSVEPSAGRLEPGQQLPLLISFQPGEMMAGRPVYFRLDVVLEGGMDMLKVPVVAMCLGMETGLLTRLPPFSSTARASTVH